MRFNDRQYAFMNQYAPIWLQRLQVINENEKADGPTYFQMGAYDESLVGEVYNWTIEYSHILCSRDCSDCRMFAHEFLNAFGICGQDKYKEFKQVLNRFITHYKKAHEVKEVKEPIVREVIVEPY